MNLGDYEKKWFSTYRAFAEKVRFILEEALRAADNLPRPQSIQCRAKGVTSLRQRLAEANKLETQTLECDRRDLAGVRVIFYTNNDIDCFLRSSVIYNNFEVEEDSTKIHYPTEENKKTQYRAVHYTVRLGKNRICLPEYAQFAGLRCEIQVQTILNHAWSETSHDIIYKDNLGDGFGRKAMEGIKRRFDKVVDDYLIPAGYEIQKAQQEYERILKGKELFDKDIVNVLDNAQDNNERYEILSRLKDYAIPNYDNLQEAYEGLQYPLLKVVKAARVTKPVPIQTTFGPLDGFKADSVTQLVVQIVENLRYVDVVGTLKLLIDIYKEEPSDDIRTQIVNVIKRLSEYTIETYEHVGPMLQMELVDYLAGMSHSEIDNIRPIALAIWTEALEPDITGTICRAESLTFRRGAVPVNDPLREVRDKAITALFALYDRSTNDAQKREVLSALYASMNVPGPVECPWELTATILKNTTRIVDFVTERAKATSYELLQHLEHQFHREYFDAARLSEDSEKSPACKKEAASLVTAILKFRDTINLDDRFVKYKVLVGFESVYPNDWIDEKVHYKGADEYRQKEADRYIDEINVQNETDWFGLIARCAETKSNDWATFPVFGQFINKLAERKPEVADRLLASASDSLRNFLPGFPNGFVLSGRNDVYERVLESELKSARSLAGLAKHLCYSSVSKAEFTVHVLECAIEQNDIRAVLECLVLAVENYGTEKIADADTFVREVLSFLNDRKDTRWVKEIWFREKAKNFFEQLTLERTKQILQNLSYLTRVDHETERILAWLAERELEAVWDYFGDRLAREVAVGEEDERFEAVPHRFHGLEKELSKDPQVGIIKGLAWFNHDRGYFEFRGGRMLSSTFSNCPPKFATALAALVKAGGDTEVDFVLAIIRNYHGEISTHAVLKEIVARFPGDDSKMSRVAMAIDSTGVVCGEFGLADAYRAKKDAMEKWLTDERPAVHTFAKKHIAGLDLMITSEQARVEAAREMRKRDYDEEDDESDMNDGDEGKMAD